MAADGLWLLLSLRWRHGHDSVSNHQPHDCLLNRSFRRRSKKTSKLRVTGLCVGTSPGTGEFPAQMASNAENVSIWWRHHEKSRSPKDPRVEYNTIDIITFGVILISVSMLRGHRGISADIIFFYQVTLHLANPSASPGELFLSYVIDFRSKRLQQFMNKDTPGLGFCLQ